ncbi:MULTISPECIES: DUF488 family protein [Cyanophyceae]|uniref:DUF488 domain-containing protein n=1 Tax=Cyanophyceae TaxID=3028117 RepID=UPI00232E52DC|nr:MULTISPECIES: DUF488 domain-containing protein [Cyanophyceae]MDB9356218.1 DUF488 domain-containing protein [Nodularia spumigena CS-587/03]MDB9340880.1 DUF488 domain-containing protein [Nodularia spumigena CS-589/07]MDB9342802.1 DUF488 domain-containing protein [Nodularia spumigena CS-588/06]MDB9371125.1 DUF488 domain-containing protein [Nodularia spumigena CS-586/05]MDB9399985.1 DUF488 domain-containing protein [Microcystis aeruginosa CS-567/02-A1]
MKIFTIGHSNHSIASFIENLKQNGITAVADVRSSPYSQRFPHFNQSAFKKALQTVDIAYVSLGDNLGARPNDRSCYVEGMARYDLISATKAFATGLNRLIKGIEELKLHQFEPDQFRLTISLSEPFIPSGQEKKFCYKLVAAVINVADVKQRLGWL